MEATLARNPRVMHGATCVAGFLGQFPTVRPGQVAGLLAAFRETADRAAAAVPA